MYQIVIDIIVKLAPIFILIGLGIWVRYINLIKEDAIDDLKKIIINISLPAILFSAFLNIDLKFSYIFIFLLIFILCIVLYFLGFVIRKIFNIHSDYVPFLSTGFEFGMMGVVFFGTTFGLNNMAYIGLIALGHEFFIWFVYVTLLKRKIEGNGNILGTMKNFVASPVIIAIILGTLSNLFNLKNIFERFLLTKAIFQSLNYLSNLTVPLILIIIGFNIRFKFQLIKEGISLIISRFFIILVLTFFIDLFIFKKLLHLDNIFSAALYTFAILPPPFILPLFIKKENEIDIHYINGVLLLYSILSIFVFSIYFIIYSMEII